MSGGLINKELYLSLVC